MGIVSIGAGGAGCSSPPKFETATTCLRRFSKIETRWVKALFCATSRSTSGLRVAGAEATSCLTSTSASCGGGATEERLTPDETI